MMKRWNMLMSARPTGILRGRVIGCTFLVPIGIHHVRECRSPLDSGWIDESEVVASTDPELGSASIFRRGLHGALHRLMAVDWDHPFGGGSAVALPHELRTAARDGVNDAQSCECGEPRSTGGCRVRVPRAARDATRGPMTRGENPRAASSVPLRDVQMERRWSGFRADCGHHVPARRGDRHGAPCLARQLPAALAVTGGSAEASAREPARLP